MANLRIDVPPARRPRLPRDHFAMRPQLSRRQRLARAAVAGAVIGYALAIFYVHHHPH